MVGDIYIKLNPYPINGGVAHAHAHTYMHLDIFLDWIHIQIPLRVALTGLVPQRLFYPVKALFQVVHSTRPGGGHKSEVAGLLSILGRESTPIQTVRAYCCCKPSSRHKGWMHVKQREDGHMHKIKTFFYYYYLEKI